VGERAKRTKGLNTAHGHRLRLKIVYLSMIEEQIPSGRVGLI
jgi:hypothetical protein